MDYQLVEVSRLRKKHQLTQKELSNRAGVSQSLIAKIEAGKMDPSYSKAQQIFNALHNLENSTEPKAKELMNIKILFAKSHESVKEIIKLMKIKGISQVPIFSGEKVIGIITESAIIKELAENPQRINHLKAHEVMEETPPIISLQQSFRTILELLKENSLLLVAEKGEIKGVITKSDLLGKVR